MFSEIWKMQGDLNAMIGYDTINAKNKEEWLFMYCEALHDEIMELIECFEIYPETPNRYFVSLENYKNAKIEAIDCLHFLMSVFHILELNDKNVFLDYIKTQNSKSIFPAYWEISEMQSNPNDLFKYVLNMLTITNTLKNKTNWKWWSKSVRQNKDRQFKEIISKDNINSITCEIFLNLMHIFYNLGFTLNTIHDIYLQKWKINIQRQHDGYDVKTKTEKDNQDLERKI